MSFNITDLALSGSSALLASIITFQAFVSYKDTRRDYLLNFFAGFLLLAVSFAILLPSDLGVHVPTCCGEPFTIETYPPRYILQTIGFTLVALAYSRNRWEKQLFAILNGLLVFLVVLVLLPQTFVPESANTLVHGADIAVVGYILYSLLRFVMRAQRSSPIDLVFAGFLLILFSQYTFVIHGFDGSGMTDFFAKALELLGLGTLVAAFFVIVRPTGEQGRRTAVVALGGSGGLEET